MTGPLRTLPDLDPFSRVPASFITLTHSTISIRKSPAFAGLFRQTEKSRCRILQRLFYTRLVSTRAICRANVPLTTQRKRRGSCLFYSICYEITNEALVFGGDVMTATDITVHLGMVEFGDTQKLLIGNFPSSPLNSVEKHYILTKRVKFYRKSSAGGEK